MSERINKLEQSQLIGVMARSRRRQYDAAPAVGLGNKGVVEYVNIVHADKGGVPLVLPSTPENRDSILFLPSRI
jgi:hypothetical protein